MSDLDNRFELEALQGRQVCLVEQMDCVQVAVFPEFESYIINNIGH